MVETGFGLQQPEAAEARMALAADDEVIVDCDAERLGGGADLLGHLDVVARRLGIVGRVVVQQATVRPTALILLDFLPHRLRQGAPTRDGSS